ncbi:hypothetical protein P154DRAFT_425437 [Amniculicola lignicola CBS 123094]|uniref:Uncharacterized protein n=1 Tax=Amniculicola lignicola CBS 123094 TaxID=1392246 RepID=A0A6A5X0R3_9PLEO|nr:hypothetical protein P154DRAFT_425437 [Amniculicola lignicola CBS 123094]
MATSSVTTVLSGAVFGAALTVSGVWSPTTIIDQMHLQDFTMLKVFLTASGASAYVIFSSKYSQLKLILQFLPQRTKCTRSPSSFGIFGKYDGNVIGGTLLGIGMTLTGACPGTVLVQVGTGTYPGIYSFAGGLAGGVLYTGLRHVLPKSPASASSKAPTTVYDEYHIRPDVAVLSYVALCAAVVAGAVRFAPGGEAPSTFFPPIIGGLTIGAAQLGSMLLRGAPVGISTAYEECGSSFWKVLGRVKSMAKIEGKEMKESPKQTWKAAAFAGGVMLGAALLTRMAPRFIPYGVMTPTTISPLQAAVGGLIMVMGARIANGCTSGHGISGMSLLAKSSILTVMSMFVGGMGFAQLMG